MPHIVDVVRVRGEDEYKEHDDYSDKDQLALEQTSYDVQPAPVEDYVADNSTDYAIKRCGGARFDNVLGWVGQVAEDVAPDA